MINLTLKNLDENYCFKLLKKYSSDEKSYNLILDHSVKVKNKALEIAKNNLEKNPNLKIIEIGALLHDIGVFKTNRENYIEHGLIGYNILKQENLPIQICNIAKHHTGVGLTKEDIINQKLNLPIEDLIPQNIEEEIVCLADKFFSKSQNNKEKSIEEVKNSMLKFGKNKLDKLNKLLKKYKIE